MTAVSIFNVWSTESDIVREIVYIDLPFLLEQE